MEAEHFVTKNPKQKERVCCFVKVDVTARRDPRA